MLTNPLCVVKHSWETVRQWHPTPVLLPGNSHGQRSLVGCSPWGREESDTTEQLHFHFSLSRIGEGNVNPLMSTHFSVLVWRIPGMGEPGGLLSMGSHRVGHDWSDLAAAAAAESSGYLRETKRVCELGISDGSTLYHSDSLHYSNRHLAGWRQDAPDLKPFSICSDVRLCGLGKKKNESVNMNSWLGFSHWCFLFAAITYV